MEPIQDDRPSEIERRELAQQHKGEVVPGSGRAVNPRQLDSIITVRFDAATHKRIREVAKQMDLPYTRLVRLAVTRFLALPDEWQPSVDIIYTEHRES
jgi:hypothetical protein